MQCKDCVNILNSANRKRKSDANPAMIGDKRSKLSSSHTADSEPRTGREIVELSKPLNFLLMKADGIQAQHNNFCAIGIKGVNS